MWSEILDLRYDDASSNDKYIHKIFLLLLYAYINQTQLASLSDA